MIILVGRFEADSADVPALRAGLADLMRSTRAEPGCISYFIAMESEGGNGVPAVFGFAERWETTEAVKAHGSAAHVVAFQKDIGRKVRNVELATYETSGPITIA